jgi:hypothetical protein
MARQGLFRMYADDISDSPRTVLRIVERTGTSVFRQTDYANDYAQQGQRYALFVSELLAELQSSKPQEAAAVEVQPQVATETKPSGKAKADPKQLVNKLRQKKANGYKYPGSYRRLGTDIGGAVGTWAKIFQNPEYADLLEWKDNRSICARNSPAAEQVAYEDEEFLPDDEVEKLYADQVKLLPKAQRQQAWEQFNRLDNETKRKTVQTLTRS